MRISEGVDPGDFIMLASLNINTGFQCTGFRIFFLSNPAKTTDFHPRPLTFIQTIKMTSVFRTFIWWNTSFWWPWIAKTVEPDKKDFCRNQAKCCCSCYYKFTTRIHDQARAFIERMILIWTSNLNKSHVALIRSPSCRKIINYLLPTFERMGDNVYKEFYPFLIQKIKEHQVRSHNGLFGY